MSEQIEQTEKQLPEYENVLPRTLGVRPLVFDRGEDGVGTEVTGVYGGRSGTVWVATFADNQEAQAWILASNAFGQPVRGIVHSEVANGPRVQS